MTEPTEAKIIKEKKPRTEAQLLILAEARKKASAVRAENKLLREQEKEMARDLKAKAKEERMAKVKAHQESKKVKKPPPQEELKPETDFMDESSDEEIVVMKKSKPKAKKKKVRVVYESEEEQEEDPVPVRKTRVVSDTPPPPSPAQILQKKLYQQMFSM